MDDKTLTYLDWLKHLPKDDSLYFSCDCPACGKKGLSYQYIGFKNSDIGWKIVWCESCRSGVQVCRTNIPENAGALIDDKAKELFFESKNILNLTF
jgi:hypothetical protein